MDLQLQGKNALVTGSTGGIGYAIAKTLACEGANVYVNGRSKEGVEKAIQKLEKEGAKGKLIAAPLDLSLASSQEELKQIAPAVDILINNLGIYEVKAFENISDEDWLHIFQVNVLSGIRLSRYYLPKMKIQNWGRIIFISSESGVNIPSEMIHYGVTKSSQIAVARGLAETTVGTNVTVNSVLPGPTLTEGVKEYVSQVSKSKGITTAEAEKELFETLRPSSLIKRFSEPDEIAFLVACVSSPKSASVNGAALRVEGGVIRSMV
jgi:NAD(P)-dependent dehydrogenase (short-subunit alcohol dehydrogenase family)